MRRAARWPSRAVAVLVGVVAVGAVVAPAADATVTVDKSADFSPRGEELFTGPTPRFNGTGEPGGAAVVIQLYNGPINPADLVAEFNANVNGSGEWAASPPTALSGGTYIVKVAEAEIPVGTSSEEIPFTVDATPPQVKLSSPSNGSSGYSSSEVVSGPAGTEAGDLPTITIDLYSGSSASGSPVQAVSTQRSNGGWSVTFGGLGPGTYTAQAEQRDDVGNVGHSEAATFTVLPPVPPSPPAASFEWIPSAPQTGEPVTLVSTSTDPDTTIRSFAWALAGNGVFGPGASALATTFSTPGPHVVQLLVTDANGLSSVATKTIPVTSPAPTLMQPFPVVRIVGSYSSSGAKIKLLTVLAPVGATIRVTCRGGGCATKSQQLVAASLANTMAGTTLITFRRFERALRAGAFLDVWVSRQGQIGKFTRFRIRHGKVPTRTDLCLNPPGTQPIVCPSH
jgi:hypothetical protein